MGGKNNAGERCQAGTALVLYLHKVNVITCIDIHFIVCIHIYQEELCFCVDLDGACGQR